MRQKVNPLIFRSKIFPYYINIWNNFNYVYLKLSYLLNLKKFVEFDKKLNILCVKTNFCNKEYCIYNIVLFSKIMYLKNKEYTNIFISKLLKKNFFNNINIGINFVTFKHPLLSVQFILKYIYNKVLNPKNFLRKIIPQLALIINKKYKIKGFKCIVSGRINGVQMAKSETFKFSESSTQNKTSYIKYGFINIPTKYGSLGVKIWLFL